MSRVGNQPVTVPQGVKVSIAGSDVTVEGPRGSITLSCHPDMILSNEDASLKVARPTDQRQHRALHGLTRSLLFNMVTGVSQGFEKSLELVGIGYRAQQEGDGVRLNVMLSHTVDIPAPDGIEIAVEGNNIIRVRGVDKQAVGQIAAQIRRVRPPNAYTGKGIRYQGEQAKIKPGKSARRALV